MSWWGHVLNKRAFSIIELVIYISIFSVFSLLIFGFLAKNFKRAFVFENKNKKDIRNIAMLSLLRRDLLMADCNKESWDLQNFVFKKNINIKRFFREKTGDRAVGWSFRDKNIYRTIGEYDFLNKKWIKKNVAKLNFGIAKFTYNIITSKMGDSIKSVIVCLDGKNFYINLRNRIIKIQI